VIAKGSTKHGVLAHDNLDIGDDREGVFFINQTVGGSSEDYIRNQFGLLIDTMMLSDRYGDSKVIVL
jgi:hypothetical protein